MLDTLKSVPPHEAGLENSLRGDIARLGEMYQDGNLTYEEYADGVALALSVEQTTWDVAKAEGLILEQAEILFGRLFSEEPISQ